MFVRWGAMIPYDTLVETIIVWKDWECTYLVRNNWDQSGNC